MKKNRLFAIIPVICIISCAHLQAQDTSKHAVTLPEVIIESPNTPPSTLNSNTPTQVIAAEELVQRGNTLLSDAVKQMTGIALKDYGGVGGIKTVSARGLGSQFSTLTIDGIAVNDCQNGQIDLGRYQLGNSSFVSFANGHLDNPFPSARALAAGNILNMETHVPVFTSRSFHLVAGAEGGSFGYLSPTLGYEQRLGRRTSLSLYANHTQSEGDYPYTLYYTRGRTDSCSREIRQNSQMRLTTLDLNLFHRIDGRQDLRMKGHYMQGFHALPGPVIYYTAKASEHTEEQLGFLQARYRLHADNFGLQLIAKYQSNSDIYEDTAARTPSHLLHDEYHQQEGYLSQVLRWRHAGDADAPGWEIRFSADESLAALTSNLSSHNEVQRQALQGALAADYQFRGVRASAHLLGTYVRDHETAINSDPYTKLSPYAGLTWKLPHLTLRYFYKETYRVPNFNELYYFTVGRALRPEKAAQHNIGLSCSPVLRDTCNGRKRDLAFDLNGYYNQVSDKIIAVPTQNMFLWSMSNLGEVSILGVDASCSGTREFACWTLRTDIGYSFQHATDRTDPNSKCYGHQIPYTPRHSGSLGLTVETPWVNANYNATWVGSRYSTSQNTPENRLPAYLDQGITLLRDWTFNHIELTIKAQVLNIFDVQYEVVRNYPMMGRNYRLGVTCNL